MNGVGGFDDIGRRLAGNHQDHSRLIAGEAGVAHVLHRIGDLGHIAQAHHLATAVTDDQRDKLGRRAQLVVAVHLPVLGALLHRPFWPFAVGRTDGATHLVEGQAVVIQRIRIKVDAHRRQRTTGHTDLADTVDLGNLLRQYGRGQVIQLATAEGLGGQGENHDRHVGRVGLAVAGVARHAGGQQGHGRVDGRLHLSGGAVDVALQVKLQDHLGAAETARRGHLDDPGNPPEGPLQRRGHRTGHGFRAGAGHAGADHDIGEVDLWQRRHWQQTERQTTGQQQGQGQQ